MGLYSDYSTNTNSSVQLIPYDISKQTAFYQDVQNILSEDNYSSIKWNTYYYKRYKALNSVLYFIMIICIILIFLTLIKKSNPYFDDKSYSIIVGVVLALSVIYIVKQLWSIMFRDKQNFDEYDYSFNTNGSSIDISNNRSECVSVKPLPEVNYSIIK
jgi:hypothetical protein